MGLGGILVLVALVFSVFIFGYLVYRAAAGWGVLHAILISLLFIECWVFLVFSAGVQGFRVKHTKDAAENTEKALAAAELTEELRWGDYNDKNLNAYIPAKNALRRLSTDRGRVWRRVSFIRRDNNDFSMMLAADALPGANANGDPAGAPVGSESLPAELVIYAFSEELNAEGQPLPSQYLGEFTVKSSDNGAVVLSPSMKLTPTQQQLVGQASSWTLFELLPADTHDAFAEIGSESADEEIFGHMDEAALNELFAGIPEENGRRAAVVRNYLRDGTQADESNDPLGNLWYQVRMLKTVKVNVDNTGDSADTDRTYFDVDGRAIDTRLKRTEDNGVVQLTPEIRDQRIVLAEPDAQALIDAGNAELVRKIFVRTLRDYRQEFSIQTISLQEVLERIDAFTRARDEMTAFNAEGQRMLAEEQTVQTNLQQDLAGYTREVEVLTSAAMQAETELSDLKATIRNLYNSVQGSGI